MVADRPYVADWATDWDFYGSQYHNDPPSVWAELRERCPVPHTDRYGGAWAAIRYEDVCAAAHDPATFSSRHTGVFEAYEKVVVFPPVNVDPPSHGEFRRLLLPQFGPAAVAALRSRTERVCEELLDAIEGEAHVDAAAAYSSHVPVAVIVAMLGIPEADADTFRSWVHDILEAADSATHIRAMREALAYFRAQVDDRRAEPGDDLISLLVNSEYEGGAVPDRMIAASALVLLLAGIDTVWSVLGAAIHHLASHPDDLRRLQDEPGLLDTAVEAFLRFYAPAMQARCVTRDATLAGTPIDAGAHLMLSFPAANRDPDVFPDADTFVIGRALNRHVAFGVGIHRCIGSNTARMELQVGLEAWIRRVRRFTTDPSHPVAFTTGGGIRGPRSVPLVIDWS